MSDEKPTTASQENLRIVTVGDLKQHEKHEEGMLKKFTWKDAALVAAILSGFLGGYVHLLGEARAQSDAGVTPLSRRLDQLEAAHVSHVKDAGEAQRLVREQMHEVQMDIRALYRSQRTGERAPRLEKPPVDGGP